MRQGGGPSSVARLYILSVRVWNESRVGGGLWRSHWSERVSEEHAEGGAKAQGLLVDADENVMVMS